MANLQTLQDALGERFGVLAETSTYQLTVMRIGPIRGIMLTHRI